MANEPINPHDAFFKQYLSRPQVAADFLRQHLPVEVAKLLDLTQLELAKDSFVDERLRSHFGDLVYRTRTNTQTPLSISLLFEHKSYPDEWVDFQVLRYQVNLWQQEFDQIEKEAAEAKAAENEAQPTQKKRQPRKRTLTPILVLLVYHGQEKWQVSLRFARHLTGMEDPESHLAKALARYMPDFEPHFVNLTDMSDAAIQGEMITQIFLLVLKHIFEQELGGRLHQVLEMAAQVMRQPSGMEMVVALLRYIGRSGIQVNKDEVAQKLLALLPKEGGVLMQTMAEEWIAEGKVIGLREGEEKGRKDGLREGRQETLRLMILRILQRRFAPNEALLQQIEQQLTRVHDEDALNRLADIALEVIVMPDFALKVQEFVLPSA